MDNLEIHITDHEGTVRYNPNFIIAIMGTYEEDHLGQQIVIEGRFNSCAIRDSMRTLNEKLKELQDRHEQKLKDHLQQKGLTKDAVLEMIREIERLYRSPD